MALLAAARFTCIIQRTRGFNAGLEGTLFTDISRVPFMFVMMLSCTMQSGARYLLSMRDCD